MHQKCSHIQLTFWNYCVNIINFRAQNIKNNNINNCNSSEKLNNTVNTTNRPAGISKISNFDNWYGGQIEQRVVTAFLCINSICKTNPFRQIYLLIIMPYGSTALLLLYSLYCMLSHSQSEESQVRGGHKSVSENPAVKFSF